MMIIRIINNHFKIIFTHIYNIYNYNINRMEGNRLVRMVVLEAMGLRGKVK